VHVYVDPLFGGKYKWENRRNSLVTIESRLLLPSDWLPLKLKIQRSFLQALLKKGPLEEKDPFDFAIKLALDEAAWPQDHVNFLQEIDAIRLVYFGQGIALHLKKLSEQGSVRREKIVSLPVFPSRRLARFTISRDSLPLLKEFFSSPPPQGWTTHVSFLSSFLIPFFLSETIMKRILYPARGREFKKQIFADLLPSAYLACWELVSHSYRERAIKTRINNIMDSLKKNDEEAYSYLIQIDPKRRDKAVWICLVYWAFDGAWQKFGIDPFQSPEEVRRRYIPPEKRSPLIPLFIKTRSVDPTIEQLVRKRWMDLYLEERGAAVKAFDLL